MFPISEVIDQWVDKTIDRCVVISCIASDNCLLHQAILESLFGAAYVGRYHRRHSECCNSSVVN